MPILTALLPGIMSLLERAFPDPEERAKQLQSLVDSAQAADATQSAINQAEASNSTLFVAGWRPFIGWICGAAFAYHYIFQPLIAFTMSSFGHKVELPVFNMDELSTVLMGMLGLGSLRTIEKIKMK